MGAAALVIGAQATMAAAQAVGQVKAAKGQYYVTKAGITIDKAQKDFELARTAAMEAEEFRKTLATQTALSTYRGTSGARQFGGESFATFARDLEAVERGYAVNAVRAQNAYASASAAKSASIVGAVTGFGSSILTPQASGVYKNLFKAS